MDSKDNYEYCLSKGQKWEDIVQHYISQYLHISLNSKYNPEKPDFVIYAEVDLKIRLIPFRKAKEYVGLEPWEALPININKLERYPDKAWILFIVGFVNYTTSGIYMIPVSKIRALRTKYPGRIHHYKDRVHDTRNAKSSFYVSIKECYRLPINIKPYLDAFCTE